MKTYAIELQRIKAMKNAHGLVQARVDLVMQPQPAREEGEPTSTLTMTVENARTLFLLLKAQLAEVDSKKARSQR